MTGPFIICLVALLLLAEYFPVRYYLSHLKVEHQYDTLLTAPGETVTLKTVLRNLGRLPVLYLRLVEYLPDTFLVPKEELDKGEVKASIGGKYKNRVLYLMPHSRFTTEFRFSLPERGVYCAESYCMEAGDLLGITSKVVSGSIPDKITVMPRRCANVELNEVLGGWLGDISVRRFILEDPVLTTGYREYTGVEPMRSISWKQSARTGSLQVKKFDHTADAVVTVLLNLQNGRRMENEACLEICRTVCETLEQKHIPYSFATNGDLMGPISSLRWVGQGLGRQHIGPILYGMGRCAPVCMEPLSDMVDRCTDPRRAAQGSRCFLLITPPGTKGLQREKERLQAMTDRPILVLEGREELYSGFAQEGAV